MQKYTVILVRSWELTEAFENDDDVPDAYVASVEAENENLAVVAAKDQIIEADLRGLKHVGYVGRAAAKMTERDNYSVLTVFEGHPKCLHIPGTTPPGSWEE